MTDENQKDLFGGQLPALRPLSRIEQRLIRSSVEIEADDPDAILFQHTVFCQTGLPYRNPGDEVRIWDRENGLAALRVKAGEARHPTDGWVDLGLPFGPKPRLILAYLNAEALRTGAPVVEVEDSLTAFVQRIGLCRDGRSIRTVKDQLSRLAAAEIRLAVTYGAGQARQVQAHIVGEFDLWFPKQDDRQRVLWPTTVTLDPRYFESLQRHAVPLDERAVAALSHSAMGLDIYAWLAQRLHRVSPSKPAFIPWTALKAQFGWHYGRMDKFKAVFRQTLDIVTSQYRGARLELDDRGMTLRHSPPPVKGRMALISQA
jgi:hypothetical protein